MKISIEGNAREVAELISAIQEQPELQALRRKPFNTLTTDDFARIASAHGDAMPKEETQITIDPPIVAQQCNTQIIM